MQMFQHHRGKKSAKESYKYKNCIHFDINIIIITSTSQRKTLHTIGNFFGAYRPGIVDKIAYFGQCVSVCLCFSCQSTYAKCLRHTWLLPSRKCNGLRLSETFVKKTLKAVKSVSESMLEMFHSFSLGFG